MIPNRRIVEWYDSVDCPQAIRQVLDAAIHDLDTQANQYQCQHDLLLARLVLALTEHYAPNDSQSLWKWLEEMEPALTEHISSRNV